MPTDSTDILHSGALDNLEDYRIFRRRYPQRDSLPTKSISDWHLQETPFPKKPRNMWVCLVGVCEGVLVRTSPVTSVLGPRKVCTGNCIYVLGPSTRVLEHPVRGLEKLFADGFPSDWESLVEQALSGFAMHSGTLRDEPVHSQDRFPERPGGRATKTSSMHSASSGHIDLSYNGDVDDSINALLSLTPSKSSHANANDALPHSKCASPLSGTERALSRPGTSQTADKLRPNDRPAPSGSSSASGTVSGMGIPGSVCASESLMAHGGALKAPLVSDHPGPEQRSFPPIGHLRKKPVIRIPPRAKLPIQGKASHSGTQTPGSAGSPPGAPVSFISTRNPPTRSMLSTEDISVPSDILNNSRTSPATAANKNRKRKLRLVMPKRFKMLSRRKY